MIYVVSVLFPIIAIVSSLWILIAMFSYVAEIQRDIKLAEKK